LKGIEYADTSSVESAAKSLAEANMVASSLPGEIRQLAVLARQFWALQVFVKAGIGNDFTLPQ